MRGTTDIPEATITNVEDYDAVQHDSTEGRMYRTLFEHTEREVYKMRETINLLLGQIEEIERFKDTWRVGWVEENPDA